MREMSVETVPLARRHPVPPGELTWEPSQRWVRATIGDVTVVDSHHPVLVWEPGRAVPRYVFPSSELRTDLLEEVPPPAEDLHPGATTWYDLVLGDKRYPHLAWAYGVGELAGHIAVDWFRRDGIGVDHWYEEEEEVFIHPRDPYKRVDPLPSSRHVQVAVGGQVVADTTRPILLFETRLPIRYYIPPEDVNFSLLEESDLETGCPYKGKARYWSVRGAPDADNIVWAYPDPVRAAGIIKDHVAFYNEVVDITVDGELLERPVSEFSARLHSR
jgi:uncharacterized protein (DUF427 family)